jgi:hypothetical protein
MAITPSYGWVTPSPTDFVTDLPADFETFADAVDADLAGLLGGTTGQILSKTSGADHDFTWTAAPAGIPATILDAKGDLIAATADDTPAKLTVGSNGTVLIADSSQATGLRYGVDPATDLVTTAGDLLYGTGADALARLGIGTAGQVLTVNSGETAPEWASPAGALTQLATGSLTGSSVTLSSISQGFKDLILVVRGFQHSGNSRLALRWEGITSSTYAYNWVGNSSVSSGTLNAFWVTSPDAPTSSSKAFGVFKFHDYANTSTLKIVTGFSSTTTTTGTTGLTMVMGQNQIDTAIDEIVMIPQPGAGHTFTGGTYFLFGVK